MIEMELENGHSHFVSLFWCMVSKFVSKIFSIQVLFLVLIYYGARDLKIGIISI